MDWIARTPEKQAGGRSPRPSEQWSSRAAGISELISAEYTVERARGDWLEFARKRLEALQAAAARLASPRRPSLASRRPCTRVTSLSLPAMLRTALSRATAAHRFALVARNASTSAPATTPAPVSLGNVSRAELPRARVSRPLLT